MAEQTFDFDTYLPAFSEIPESKLLEVRERIEAFYVSNFPDIDTSPNSVVGDLVITPMAYYRAAEEIALSRFMSDLDLENVANGVIWNCDFVTEYLKNFATADRNNLRSTGIVRLTFDSDADVIIDRRIRFNFGTSDSTSNTFNMRLNNNGPFEVVRVGSPLASEKNTKNLSQVGENQYVVDIPVIGVMDTLVESGNDAAVDITLPGLIGAQALIDFDFGLPPDGLPTIAQKTRETFYSCTPNNRGGAINFIKKEFPDAQAVSPALTGDFEMVRDLINPLGVPSGKMDIHVKSGLLTDTIIKRFTYVQALDVFRAKVDFPEVPLEIKSITDAGDVNQEFNPRKDNVNIIVQTADRVRLPGLSCSYTPYQNFWMEIKMPRDPATNVPLVDTLFEGGQQFADFSITYTTDPLVSPVNDAVNSSTYKPVGVDIIARAFVPVVIDSMNIVYTRASGTTVALETAAEEIFTYFTQQLGWPKLYTDARIYDAMFYAGASDVKSVTFDAFVQFSPAKLILDDNAADLMTDWDNLIANNTKPIPKIPILQPSQMKPQSVDPFIGDSAQETFYAIGDRNTNYLIEEGVINFSEDAV